MKNISNQEAQIANLNRQYNALLKVSEGKAINAMSPAQFESYRLAVASASNDFDRTMTAIMTAGEVVKFDSINGEYFTGENRHRVVVTVVSRGVFEIEADTSEKAKEIVEASLSAGEIDLAEDDIEIEICSELA